jgi:hypothetical protein
LEDDFAAKAQKTIYGHRSPKNQKCSSLVNAASFCTASRLGADAREGQVPNFSMIYNRTSSRQLTETTQGKRVAGRCSALGFVYNEAAPAAARNPLQVEGTDLEKVK